jgi:MFS family permease
MLAGLLADRFDKGRLLASGYFVAGIMALAVILLPANFWTLAAVFAIGGIYVAMEETLEDSFCAELVSEAHHGMAFGTLATVNGVGDFASSLIVGLLWTMFGTSAAFGYSAVLFLGGAVMVLRVSSIRDDRV